MIKNITLTILLALFLGCSKKEPSISFSVGGAPNEIEFWEKLAKEFEQKTNIKVNIIRQPTDTDQRRQGLVIPLESGKTDPDVFLMDIAWLPQFAASDWLEPLDNYMNDENTEPLFTNVVNLADRYRGGLVALPVYIDGGLLYYRTDLLEKYGHKNPPETWDELINLSLKIQPAEQKNNPNFYGFLWQGAQYEGLVCNFLEFISSNNGGIIIAGDRISLNIPRNIEAVKLMTDLLNKYKISPPNTFTEFKEEEVRTSFQQGNALFERNWPYAYSLHKSDDSKIKDNFAIALLPHFKNGESASTLGGWHIGISKYSDVKIQSAEFLKFITSRETQKKLALELGWNPARTDIYNDDDVTRKLPHFAVLKKIFENAIPRPNLPYYTQISEIIQKELNAALSGKITPEEALANAETEAQKIIDRYKE